MDDDSTTQALIVAADDLAAVMDELPAETAGRLQVILDALVYERVVLCREGHQPPFELSAFDVRQIENAIGRLPGTEDERRAARSVEPG